MTLTPPGVPSHRHPLVRCIFWHRPSSICPGFHPSSRSSPKHSHHVRRAFQPSAWIRPQVLVDLSTSCSVLRPGATFRSRHHVQGCHAARRVSPRPQRFSLPRVPAPLPLSTRCSPSSLLLTKKRIPAATPPWTRLRGLDLAVGCVHVDAGVTRHRRPLPSFGSLLLQGLLASASRGSSSLSSALDLLIEPTVFAFALTASPFWPSASSQLLRWVVCLQTSTLPEISSLAPLTSR